jgi:redox-sensitive bicupin YhaK (pirin superfamily)
LQSEEAIKVNQDSKVFASILERSNKLVYRLPDARFGYLHVVQSRNKSALKINGVELQEGDGVFIEDAKEELEIESTGEGNAEFLLFDLA